MYGGASIRLTAERVWTAPLAVIALELSEGSERNESVRALKIILAAQLATVLAWSVRLADAGGAAVTSY